MQKQLLILIFTVFSSVTAAGSRYYLYTAPADTIRMDTTVIINDTTSIDDTVALADTSTLADTSMIAQPAPDTLRPVFQRGFTDIKYGVYTKKSVLNRKDYRYAGDFFNYMNNGYMQDPGQFGTPAEVFLYSLGYNNISFMENGVLANTRMYNAYDLNWLQGEAVDSIEVAPLPRGFLYSPANNPVSVNFLMRDRIASQPYTRIRFYQAPNDEGFADVFFNMYLGNRVNGTFQITNGTQGATFSNTSFSTWKYSARLRYMPANQLNLIGSYNYMTSETNLFGGVDYAEIVANSSGQNADDILYDRILAPVNYPAESNYSFRYQKYTSELATLQLLSSPGKYFYFDMLVYYRARLQEYRQDEKNRSESIPTIVNNNLDRSWGIRYRQELRFPFLDLSAGFNGERVVQRGSVLKKSELFSQYAVYGLGSIKLFDDRITASGFTKFMYRKESVFTGFGADATLGILKNLNLYGGASWFERPYTIIREQYKLNAPETRESLQGAEAGLWYWKGENSLKLNLFTVNRQDALIAAEYETHGDVQTDSAAAFFPQDYTNGGIGLNFRIRYGVLQAEGNINYNVTGLRDIDNSMPAYNAFAGLYYVDSLFDGNLDLKTGLNFYAYGKQNYLNYDYQKYTAMNYLLGYSAIVPYVNETTDEFQLDLFASGQIRERAIVYLVVENVLMRNYYLIPYYPKQETSFRFGLAWELLN